MSPSVWRVSNLLKLRAPLLGVALSFFTLSISAWSGECGPEELSRLLSGKPQPGFADFSGQVEALTKIQNELQAQSHFLDRLVKLSIKNGGIAKPERVRAWRTVLASQHRDLVERWLRLGSTQFNAGKTEGAKKSFENAKQAIHPIISEDPGIYLQLVRLAEPGMEHAPVSQVRDEVEKLIQRLGSAYERDEVELDFLASAEADSSISPPQRADLSSEFAPEEFTFFPKLQSKFSALMDEGHSMIRKPLSGEAKALDADESGLSLQADRMDQLARLLREKRSQGKKLEKSVALDESLDQLFDMTLQAQKMAFRLRRRAIRASILKARIADRVGLELVSVLADYRYRLFPAQKTRPKLAFEEMKLELAQKTRELQNSLRGIQSGADHVVALQKARELSATRLKFIQELTAQLGDLRKKKIDPRIVSQVEKLAKAQKLLAKETQALINQLADQQDDYFKIQFHNSFQGEDGVAFTSSHPLLVSAEAASHRLDNEFKQSEAANLIKKSSRKKLSSDELIRLISILNHFQEKRQAFIDQLSEDLEDAFPPSLPGDDINGFSLWRAWEKEKSKLLTMNQELDRFRKELGALDLERIQGLQF